MILDNKSPHSIQIYIKEYVDALNRYIQWLVYDDIIDKQGDNWSGNLLTGFLITSKVFIYLAVQGHDIEYIKKQVDSASMYYIEFYREFGMYTGLFEYTILDTMFFIFDKTVLCDSGVIENIEYNTESTFDMLSTVARSYERNLYIIAHSSTRDSQSTYQDQDESKIFIESVNLNILPIMRDIIRYSELNSFEKTIKYINEI